MPQAAAVGTTTIAHEYGAPPFACSWQIGGWDAAWVQVAGELDLATSPQFRQRLGEAQRAVRLIVLDLRELGFIDSSGIHAILDAAHDSRRYGGRLLIVRGPAPIDQVLTLTEVDKQITIFDPTPAEPASAPPHIPPPKATA